MQEETPVDFETVAKKRRTVREFDERSVPDEIVKRAISLAFKAPSYNHLRQWDFVLVTKFEVKQALTRTETMSESVTPEIEKQFGNVDVLARHMYLDAIPKQKRMILSAPIVCVVVYKPKTSIECATRIYDLNCLASVWCCIENFLLSLAENDVFGVTFIPQNTPAIKKVLYIPENLEVAALIPIGYRKTDSMEIPQKDIRLDDHIHREKW